MNAKQFTTNKDLRVIIEALLDQGWRIEKGNGGHIKAYPPDKTMPIVVMASTPSDARAIKNIRAMVRRSGGIV